MFMVDYKYIDQCSCGDSIVFNLNLIQFTDKPPPPSDKQVCCRSCGAVYEIDIKVNPDSPATTIENLQAYIAEVHEEFREKAQHFLSQFYKTQIRKL